MGKKYHIQSAQVSWGAYTDSGIKPSTLGNFFLFLDSEFIQGNVPSTMTKRNLELLLKELQKRIQGTCLFIELGSGAKLPRGAVVVTFYDGPVVDGVHQGRKLAIVWRSGFSIYYLSPWPVKAGLLLPALAHPYEGCGEGGYSF